MKDENRISRVAIISGLIASGLINLFLSGKIIDSPPGTPEGTIIVIGVLLITISVAAISYFIFRIEKYLKENSNNT